MPPAATRSGAARITSQCRSFQVRARRGAGEAAAMAAALRARRLGFGGFSGLIGFGGLPTFGFAALALRPNRPSPFETGNSPVRGGGVTTTPAAAAAGRTAVTAWPGA